MAGKVGFEPTTIRVTTESSTVELLAKNWREYKESNPLVKNYGFGGRLQSHLRVLT